MSSKTHFLVASLGVALAAVQLVGCGKDCGDGTVKNNGECVLIAAECGPGTTLTEGNVCVASRTGCGPFTVLDPATGQCVSSEANCGSGTSFDDSTGTCVPTTQVTCGAGTVQQGSVCVLEIDPCTDGQVLIGSACVDGGAVQLIHNAPDPALDVVDVWVNDELVADDASFRTASPFIAFPAGTEITVVIADSASTSATPLVPAATTTLTIGSGDRVAVIVGGVVDTTQFAAGAPALALDVVTGVQSSAATGLLPTQYSFALYNGSPDLGAANANVAGNAASGIPYGALTPYLALTRGVSALTLSSAVVTTPAVFQTSAASSPIAAPNGVPGGTAVLALTSGFVNPGANNGGPALAVVVALPTGGPLYVLDNGGRVQVVHNSSDTGGVDVYVGNSRLAANLDYRTATAFTTSPVSATVRVFAAGADITSATPLLAGTISLSGNGVVVIDGLSTAAASAPEALTLHTVNNARVTASSPTVASVALYNGYVAGSPFSASSYGTPIFASTAYGSGSSYVDLPPTALALDVAQSGTPFRSLQTSSTGFYQGLPAGTAWLLFASGVATTPNFVGFAIVPSTGGAFTFTDDAARAQLVHASPVTQASTVDVYVNGFLAVDDLAYASATPFVAFTSGTGVRIDIAPGATGSAFGAALPGSATPLVTVNNPNFAAGSAHYAVAVGDTAASVALSVKETKEVGDVPSLADTTFFNAVATSAVVFENEASDTSTEADDGTYGVDIAYGSFSPVVFNLPPASYGIEAANEVGDAFTPAVRGTLDLSTAAGASRLVVAAGFVTPATPDRAIKLFIVQPSGSMTELPGL